MRSLIDATSPAGEFGANLLVALAAGDVLAPALGRQGVVGGSRFVPTAAFGNIVQPGGDIRRQVALFRKALVFLNIVSDAVADRIEEVPVRVV